MFITDFRWEDHESGQWTLSAKVDKEEIYFTFDGIARPDASQLVGDAFVIAALVPSMLRKEPLVIDPSIPVSQQLLEQLPQYQEVYRHWHPDLPEIAIEAENQIKRDDGQLSACFYSGGVDSIYTVAKTKKQLDYLILAWGLDISHRETDRWNKTVTLAQQFADGLDLKLIQVKTNVKNLETRVANNHGAILISNGISLGFKQLFVPASHSWEELFPWGSHPATDPLLSNGKTQTIHHGNVHRTEKTKAIIELKHGLDELRVCNVHSDYNCGKCEKCLRTAVALRLFGSSSPALPALDSVDRIRKLRLDNHSQHSFWRDNYRLAQEKGHKELEGAIGEVLTRYRRRNVLKEFDEFFFNGSFIKLKRRVL